MLIQSPSRWRPEATGVCCQVSFLVSFFMECIGTAAPSLDCMSSGLAVDFEPLPDGSIASGHGAMVGHLESSR
jgi:hypothetical protein